MSLKIKKVVDNKSDETRTPVKLILLGDSAVGKSKLVERFLMQRYIPVQMSTYALTLYHYDFISKDDEAIDVDIWDTAGQERFSTMHPAYYHEAHACILVFDMTRKATYKNLEKWLSELRNYREYIPCVVACNKIDTDPSVVSKTFAFVEKHGLTLHYVSAADGTNVVQMFEDAIAEAVKYKKSPKNEDFMTQVLGLIKEGNGKDEAATSLSPGNCPE
ncbi:rab11B GTPase [Trypanosoma rangeli]|uniref:Rab11B GTPase n=1 Tax=Trypanosoma rangeli TaxID=5698 RepID=A0A422NH56_TRYRA|nr:rab11B GTPase [Trypanosoma rangeli]RNF04787.1 rab11B GTPase [Trypanosoma rangeli]|eukprot:RNF04787.1 rab11B GTPase [Trypanosoma rangeli]